MHFCCNEIQRGLSGLGTYSLQPEFSSLLHPADEAINLQAYSPQQIVENLKHQVLPSTTEEEIPQIASLPCSYVEPVTQQYELTTVQKELL